MCAMSPLRMLALPAHTRVELTWQLASDKDLRLVREELLRYFASDGEGSIAVSAAETCAIFVAGRERR